MRPKGFAYLDHPGPLAFAHRGATEDAPENTMRAFEAAVRLGYRYVETDVQASADGTVVLFHDDRLDRLTGRPGTVNDLSWGELRTLRVGGQEPLARLDELLGTFPDLRVNIDAKHDAVIEPLVDVIRRTGAVARVCVGAFSDRRIARIRRLLGPDLCTAMGPGSVARLVAASRSLPAGRFVEPAAQVPVRHGPVPVLTPRFVQTAHRRDIVVHAWTINDEASMHELLDLGVDGIMTDAPATLRTVLEQRGAWSE